MTLGCVVCYTMLTMDLQTLFYIVSIAFMISVILTFAFVGIALWKLKQQMGKIPTLAKTALAGLAVTKRKEILSAAGLTIGTAIASKLKEKFFDKKKS